MSRAYMTADIHEMCADAYAALDAEYGGDPEYHRLLMSARTVVYDYTRVAAEGWSDSPWRDPWLEAHLLCFYDEWDELLGIEPRYNRHDRFTAHNDAAKAAWLAAHPEYDDYRKARQAADDGRLF